MYNNHMRSDSKERHSFLALFFAACDVRSYMDRQNLLLIHDKEIPHDNYRPSKILSNSPRFCKSPEFERKR